MASGCSYVSARPQQSPLFPLDLLQKGNLPWKSISFLNWCWESVNDGAHVCWVVQFCVFSSSEKQQKWLLYEPRLCSGGVTVEEMSMHSWSCSAHMHTDSTCVGTHCVLDSKSSQVISLNTVTWSKYNMKNDVHRTESYRSNTEYSKPPCSLKCNTTQSDKITANHNIFYV